jgi:hypothetical protein
VAGGLAPLESEGLGDKRHPGLVYLTPYWTPFNTLLPCDMWGPYIGYRLIEPRLPPDAPQRAAQLWRLAEKATDPSFRVSQAAGARAVRVQVAQ